MEKLLKTTADSSFTLYVPELDEHYHSMNGAVLEARHVYLESGLLHYVKNSRTEEIQVLELGFGSGLNAFLTALEAEKQKIAINYTTLEKFPLPPDITEQLNYLPENRLLLRQLHQSEWEIPVSITPCFTLQKLAVDFRAFDFPDRYDVVYYDAFAPGKQPEVWSLDLFEKLFSAMNPGGILTTYCAKGSVRRIMQQAGFTVERIPGAGGKREMLRAVVL
ncbi:MAG: tRNA (5-methylaminomethyl-2-thiouridine)(34)-methyltransferase MnmD [Tannerella sp.]|nr:tRNA (5-methylaminomethyl-2-thiouridine)(34)-methyltransferase MnmD [Tannerella sp.]